MERIGAQTPTNIIQLFLFPYLYFSSLFGRKYLTLLDCACGNLFQKEILQSRFKDVVFVDKHKNPRHDVVQVNLETKPLPFRDKSFNIVFSFETIEHLNERRHKVFVEELLRVSNGVVVIGTISEDGPDTIGSDTIFKKRNGLNRFHKYEYSSSMFKKFFTSLKSKYITSYCCSVFDDGLKMLGELHQSGGFCNYVTIWK